MSKRGRPVGSGGKSRRLEIRMTDEEYDILTYLSRVKDKNMTSILVEGLMKSYEECKDQEESQEDYDYDDYEDYGYYDEYDEDEEDDW